MGLFNKAERKKAYLKIAVCGVSGSGKTYSSLLLAKGLAAGGRIAMIDTENGSGELYSDLMDYDVAPMQAPFTAEKYMDYIKQAEAAGYKVLIIDSLSHAWAGQGGILERVDKKAASSPAKNSFNAWKDVTPVQNQLIDTILQSKMDIIVCMRTKQAYEIVENEKGKKIPVKMGLAPIQREGLEYEFTVVFDISVEKHIATAGKDRTGIFANWADIITEDTGTQIRTWADSGVNVVSDKFVQIIGDITYVQTKSGKVDIRNVPIEQLQMLLDRPQYHLAHKAIDELLSNTASVEDSPAIPDISDADIEAIAQSLDIK